MKIRNFLLVGAVGMLCAVGMPQQASANALTNLDTQVSLDAIASGGTQTVALAHRDHPNWEGNDRHQPRWDDRGKHQPPKPPKYDKKKDHRYDKKHDKKHPPKPPKHRKPPKPPKHNKHDRHDRPMPPYGHR